MRQREHTAKDPAERLADVSMAKDSEAAKATAWSSSGGANVKNGGKWAQNVCHININIVRDLEFKISVSYHTIS